jgi:hypothetical protein
LALGENKEKKVFYCKALGLSFIFEGALLKKQKKAPFMLVENLENKKVSTSYSALLITRPPQFFRCHNNVPNTNLLSNTCCANKKINETLQKVFFLRIPFMSVIY